MKGADRNPERANRLRWPRHRALMLIACGAVAACTGGSDAIHVDLDREGWLHCAADLECAPIFLSCHGWVAARADREAEILGRYLRENDRALSVRDCAGRADILRPQALCRVNRCEARLPSTP
jgi:hypothetical protein